MEGAVVGAGPGVDEEDVDGAADGTIVATTHRPAIPASIPNARVEVRGPPRPDGRVEERVGGARSVRRGGGRRRADRWRRGSRRERDRGGRSRKRRVGGGIAGVEGAIEARYEDYRELVMRLSCLLVCG